MLFRFPEHLSSQEMSVTLDVNTSKKLKHEMLCTYGAEPQAGSRGTSSGPGMNPPEAE